MAACQGCNGTGDCNNCDGTGETLRKGVRAGCTVCRPRGKVGVCIVCEGTGIDLPVRYIGAQHGP